MRKIRHIGRMSRIGLISLMGLIGLMGLFYLATRDTAAGLELSTGSGKIQVDMPGGYRAVMNTGDTSDYIVFYDRSEDDGNPDPIHEIQGPYMNHIARSTQVYNTAQNGTTFNVPSGVTSITVKSWGAGGGGGGGGIGTGNGGAGGGGGFAQQDISVSGPESLTVYVGGGGAGAATGAFSSQAGGTGGGTTTPTAGGGAGGRGGDDESGGGGGGGGYTALLRSSTFLIQAGGGGGGGGDSKTNNGGAGGAGGGTDGLDGSNGTGGNLGTKGTSTGVGTGGTTGGSDGSGNSGGAGGDWNGDNAIAGGGGGGGGKFGGGGGGRAGNENSGGGGGGGSGLSTGTLTPGSGTTPGNNGDSDKTTNCSTNGTGGAGGGNNTAGSAGSAGCMIISWVGGAIEDFRLSYDSTRVTTVLENTPSRVRIRVAGCFDDSDGNNCLDDGSETITVAEEYTFTPYGMFVYTLTDFQTNGLTLESTNPTDGYNWMSTEADVTDAAYDDTASIYYGDGTTESSTSTDGVSFEDTNPYVVLPAHSTGSYQSAIVGVTTWFSQAGGTEDWYWDENFSGTRDFLHTRERGSTPTGQKTTRWFFLLKPKADLDTENERESFFNDYNSADALSFTTGSAWQEVGADNWNESEGAYTVTMSGAEAVYDIDGGTTNRHDPVFKHRGWRDNKSPPSVTLEGKQLYHDIDYRASVKPFSDADLADEGSGYTQLAVGGDRSNANEYLADTENDAQLLFDATTDYIYLGSDAAFTGAFVDLATVGVGSSPNIAWQYCSANSDTATACDTWASLSVTDLQSGASDFTASGAFYFTEPAWVQATANSGPTLYYIRGARNSGSYTTYPVENALYTDILLIHTIGAITQNSQTLSIPAADQTAENNKGTDPIAVWHMDENYGTTVQDSAVSAGGSVIQDHNLTVNGATWVNNGNGNGSQVGNIALQYDGTNDYLSRSYDQEFDFGTSSFTIGGWFKRGNDISAVEYLVTNFNAKGFKIYMQADDTLCFGIDDDGTSFPEDSACSTIDLANDAWHHFEAVKNGTSSITLYVDGVLAATKSGLTATGSISPSSTLYVGIDSDGASNSWQGFTDEFLIYDYARTASQVKTDLMHDPTDAVFGTSTTDPLTDGLAGWWKLDESATPAVDSSGNGNSGTWRNNTTAVPGKFGSGADFDGTDDYIQVTDNAALDITNEITISAWVNIDTLDSARHDIVTKESAYEFRIHTDNSIHAKFFGLSDDFISGTGTALSANTWYHLVTTYDSAVMRTYVNGRIDLSEPSTGSITTGTGDVYIGADSKSAATELDGTIDDVRIYNRALSPAEVESLANWGPSAVGYWNMDENTGGEAASTTSTIAVVSETSASGTTTDLGATSDFSVSKPATVNNTNYLVVIVAKDDSPGMDPPSGWTTGDELANTTGNLTYAGIYYKKVTDASSEPSTYTFTSADGTTEEFNYWIGALSNIDQTTPQDVSFSGRWVVDNDDTTPEAPSLTPTTTGAFVLAGLYVDADLDITQAGGSWSLRAETAGAANVLDVESLTGTAAVATGDAIIGGVGVGDDTLAGQFAFRPIVTAGTSAFTLYDRSGNANNGTAGGTMTESDWVAGQYGSALDFDGTNDYVRIPDDADLDFGTGSFTIAGWVNHLTMSGGADYILTKSQIGTNGGYQVYMASDGDIVFEIDDDSAWGPDDSATTTAATYDDGTWHHIAAVKNETTGIYVYVDGVLIGSDTSIAATGTLSNSNALNIAMGDNGTSGGFQGFLDDIRIYNYARTPGQIVQDMNGGHPLGGSPVASQVGFWGFNEGALNSCSGGTNDFCDKSANANDLALGQTTAGYTTNGKFGLAFDGSASYWASRADDDDFDVGIIDDLTVSLWFKSDAASLPGATEYLVNKSNTTTQGYAVYTTTSGYVCFGIDDDGSWGPDIASCNSTNLYDASWHHVVGVRDHSLSDKNYLYVDGRLIDNDSDTTTATLANGLSLYVKDDDGDSTNSFAGDIDELKIYRGALTGNEVLIDYNRGASSVLGSLSTESNGTTVSNTAAREYCIPGDTTSCSVPVGDWRLDEDTGTTANDSTDNALTGTLSGSPVPAWRTGKKGSSLEFDDNPNNNVLVTDNSLLDITGSITISLWTKGYSAGDLQHQVLVSKYDTPSNRSYAVSLSSANLVRFRLSSAGSADSLDMTSTTALTRNGSRWYHITAVYNGTNAYIYIDGALDATTAYSSGIFSGSANVRFGCQESSSAAGTCYDGLIDHVQIYNYARTPAQITWTYNQGGPTAWYRLDECTGTTAYNANVNGNGDAAGGNGTISIGSSGTNTSSGTCDGAAGEAWADGVSGRIGASLEFDNTDDYIYASSVTLPTADFTYSAWIYLNATSDERILMATDNATANEVSLAIESGNLIALVNGTTADFTSATSFSTGQWYHVLVTRSSGTFTAYINGKRDTATGSDASTLSFGGCGLLIATDADSACIGSLGNYFSGKIDDVKIWNYALTAIQARTEYNEGAAVRFK